MIQKMSLQTEIIELQNILSKVIKLIEKVDHNSEQMDQAINLVQNAGIVANMYTNENFNHNLTGDVMKIQTLKHLLGKFLNITQTKTWYAIDSWINCVHDWCYVDPQMKNEYIIKSIYVQQTK